MNAARTRQAGFTLLEVLIAMSILAVGATSILSIFVWAVSFHTKRVEENRIMELYNHATTHARIIFNEFDPSKVGQGQPQVPRKVVADLTPEARNSPDPMIAEAATKYPGFKYVIEFEDNDLAVSGSSVVVSIEIYGRNKLRDDTFSHKQFLTRNGAPVGERFKLPDISTYEKSDQKSGLDPERRG